MVEGFVNLNFTRVSDSLRVGLVLASRFLRICVPLKKGAVFFAPTVAGRAGHVVGATGTNLDANRYQEMRSLAPAYRWAIRIVIVVLVIEAAFALLPSFMADYNARFAKPPANGKDLHRPLRDEDKLEDAFAWKEERTLSRALTLQYDKVVFVLAPTDQAKAAIGKRVTVLDYPDGRLSIRYKGVELAYRTFDKLRQVSQAEIVENKRLGAVLAFIREQQIARAEPRSKKAPRRRDQSDARLFKVG